jgi:hypothetical protein
MTELALYSFAGEDTYGRQERTARTTLVLTELADAMVLATTWSRCCPGLAGGRATSGFIEYHFHQPW